MNQIQKLDIDKRIDIPFSTEIIAINREILERDFDYYDNRRRMKTSTISQLKKVLIAGQHFHAPIVVSRVRTNNKIIDGNHRIEAMGQYFDDNPTAVIEVLVVIYDNLKKGMEKEIFTIWNQGTRQSPDDFVSAWQDDIIPILPMLKDKKFPCIVAIYKDRTNENVMHLKLLAGAYIASKENKRGGYHGGKMVFVNDLKALNGEEDYDIMKQFVTEFRIEINKDLSKSNIYTNTTPFNSLFYLWYHNRHLEDFWDRFRRYCMSDALLMQLIHTTGITATIKTTEVMFERMNIFKDMKFP